MLTEELKEKNRECYGKIKGETKFLMKEAHDLLFDFYVHDLGKVAPSITPLEIITLSQLIKDEFRREVRK